MKSAIMVFLGGGSGSLVRFLLSLLLPTSDKGFPLSTFIANISACFIAGMLATLLAAPDKGQLRFLLVTGFCGGFSTFSAYSVETLRLFTDGKAGLAAIYIFASLGCCLLGAFAGAALAKGLGQA